MVSKKENKSKSRDDKDLNQTFYLKKTMIALCVGVALQQPIMASAQETAIDDELEEVTVYGVRSSLKTAQSLKRNADTHVDAISASDLGSLPDVSVVEALQRVPGVSVERFQSSNDTDHFTSEGASVSLRGLPYTRSEFNGRESFSADSGRGLSFQDVSPELLSSVEVYKNHTANQIEGGISGTINLNTRKPLDSGEQKLSFEVNGNYGSLQKDLTGGFSGLYSDSFEVEGGDIGVLVSFSDSELNFRTDGVEYGIHRFVQGVNGGAGGYVPDNAGVRTLSTERNRKSGSLVLQYENTEKTFSATAEYVRSDSTIEWVERALTGNDAADGSGASGDSIFDNGVFSTGTLTGLGSSFGPQSRRQDTTSLVEDISLNLEFQVNDRLSLQADFQYIDASRSQEDLSAIGALQNTGSAQVQVLSTGSVPDIRLLAPQGSGQSAEEFYTDPTNFFYRAAMEHIEDGVGEQAAISLDGKYDLESDFFKSVQFGVRQSDREQTTRWSAYNWGNVSENWAGGRADLSGSQGGRGYGVNGASSFGFDNFFGGGNDSIPGGNIFFPGVNTVNSYEEFLAAFPQRNGPDLAGRSGTVDGGLYLPGEINIVEEESKAIYARLNFGNDGSRFSGNVGLRYVDISNTVQGGQNFQSVFGPRVAAFLPAETVAFANGFNNTQDAANSFDDVLPSLNVKYEIDDNQLIRFGIAKAISLPSLGLLRYNYTISAPDTTNITDGDGNLIGVTVDSPFKQISGNPFLKPIEATNIDLSYENYFAEDGYFSIGVFYKDLSNFINTLSTDQTITNPSNGASQLVAIDQPVNIAEASLTGFEMSYQQFFDNLPGVWSGLGVQVNYTHLNPSDIPQSALSVVESRTAANLRSAVTEGLPLQGLSENQVNLVGIFQNDKVEARLAYNWRDEYLLNVRNVITFLPSYQEARGQVDGSIFYNINDSLQLGLQATNLLEEETRVTNQLDNDGTRGFRTAFASDTRFTMMLRGKF